MQRERIDDIRRDRDYHKRESSLNWDGLNAVVEGAVAWRKARGAQIGYARLDAPHGGIILIRENGYTTVKYADDWFRAVEERPAPAVGSNDEYNAWLFVQQTARDVKALREAAMDAKYGRVTA